MEFTEQQPAATGVGTTIVTASGVAQLVAAGSSGYNRIALTLQPAGQTFVGYASTMNATVAAIADVPSGTLFEERDYKGDIYIRTDAAPIPIRIWETRF